MIKAVIPCVIHEVSQTRASVVDQLRRRTTNANESWPPTMKEVASRICRLLKVELQLPNDHFIPDDPLPIILESGYQIDRRFFFESIVENFDLKVSDSDWQSMCDNNWSIRNFVEFVCQHGADKNAE